MKLIPNWRDAWRWFSVQALAILAAEPLVWAQLPADVKAMLPPDWRTIFFVTIAFGGILGRLVDQSGKKQDAAP